MVEQAQLIIFVKAPRPGTVKTRLATELGDDEAASAYRQLVDRLLTVLGELTSVQLRHAPDDAVAEIAPWLRPQWTSQPQGEGTLGARMLNAFAASVASGFSRTLVIGSDCPYLTPGDIRLASAALDQNDLVLGPAQDGGYWLIGMKKPCPELFDGVTWSTGTVLEQTVARARDINLRLHLLRTLSDIDTVDDWNAYLAGSGNDHP